MVQKAVAAIEPLGLRATTKVTNGGLDVKRMARHDLPLVTLATGQYETRTVKGYVDVPESEAATQLAYRLATGVAEG